MSCAFSDCGREDCPVCRVGRVKVQASASTHEPMREDARAEPKAEKEKPIWMPKRKHRVGPHR